MGTLDRFLIAGVLALSVVASSSIGATPATTRAASTMQDYFRAMQAFNRRTIVEPFMQLGHRDPKWDDDAIRYLEEACTWMTFSYARIDEAQFLYIAEKAPLKELRRLGESARAKGCRDPMFDYAYADLLPRMGYELQANALMDEAAEALLSSRYPVNRAAYAAFHQWNDAETDDIREKALARCRDLFCAFLMTWDWQGDERRVALDHFGWMVTRLPLEKHQEMIESAQSVEGVDSWMMNMFAGRFHVRAAWSPTALPAERNDDPRTRYTKHLKIARDRFKVAWELRPEYPESATGMIEVALAGGEEFDENARLWFDRAVAAQRDYLEAYRAFYYSLSPMYGGSYPEMRLFASQCLETGTFDSIVPWQFATIHEAIARDRDDKTVWTEPGVYEGVRKMADGYRRSLRDPEGKRWYDAYESAVAWRSGAYTDAVAMLDAIGDEAPTAPFARLRVMPRLAMSHAYAMATPDCAAAVRSAEEHFAGDELDDAIAAYRDLLASTKPVAKARHYIQSRLNQLEWQRKFDGGEWLDVLPTEAAMPGWEPVSGLWSIDKDGLVGQVKDHEGVLMVFGGTFLRDHFEIEAKVTLPDVADGPVVGMSLLANDPTRFEGLNVQCLKDESLVRDDWAKNVKRKMKVADAGTNTLRLRYSDHAVQLAFNDESYEHSGSLESVLPGPITYFALGASSTPGAKFRVTKLRVRKL